MLMKTLDMCLLMLADQFFDWAYSHDYIISTTAFLLNNGNKTTDKNDASGNCSLSSSLNVANIHCNYFSHINHFFFFPKKIQHTKVWIHVVHL